VAAVAATALREGPRRHGGKDYWLSTESLNGPEAAEILTEVLGRPIRCDVKGPADLETLLAMPQFPMEPNYGAAAVEFMRQVVDGRMAYIGTVRDDVPFVTGRPSTPFRQWATENRETLLRIANG
jgi:NAD(P)H dehydrogenase (quinone)